MPSATRVTDLPASTERGLPRGEPTVMIGGAPAARAGDGAGAAHHVVSGEGSVMIGNMPAARLGDPTSHGVIARGCPTVRIGSSPQARVLRAAARAGSTFCEKCELAREERERARLRRGR
jgi:uncharacterized Zn-binding protein involved in type VI secretion